MVATLLELTADLPPVEADLDLIVESLKDATLQTLHEWVRSGVTPAWSDCSVLSPELQCCLQSCSAVSRPEICL